ncbi:MAG TPA: acyl-CoA dehydrogenase [Polyangiaceae bacterium]|nr:acyl-CoA dehydrogenase [Polyangiaceae bacterium]
MSDNPLIQDRTVEFVLHDTLRVMQLTELPRFADHDRQTLDLFVAGCRRFARSVLFPTYKPMDEHAAYYENGRVHCHPILKSLYPQLTELGLLRATRDFEAGGQQLPAPILMTALAYLSAANLSAIGYMSLTMGAAHLLESFGSETVKRTYMDPMLAGQWTGTMALTEPNAGSGLTDLSTKAVPTAGGHYLLSGSKVFISGGDNDFSENIVHLALARIEGAPPGIKGISLFCVPRLRASDGELRDNDCTTAGTFHKLGFRGLPSIALNFGERGDCHGYLVGAPNQGITCMFQMMNEARIGVGMTGMATAMVAYEQALQYAKDRPQGRRFGMRSHEPPVPIIEHADVKRMLLRQKAICEGAFALLVRCSKYADLSTHSPDEAVRKRAHTLLELLTPVAKTFPAEKGFESNALAMQVHGGYGYTSEYLPEAWLRDQKLNSLHEGTTGIQSLDLLGRKVLQTQGQSLLTFAEELELTLSRAAAAGVEGSLGDGLRGAMDALQRASTAVGAVAMNGDIGRALQNSADYLDLFSTLVIGWSWLELAAAAKEQLAGSIPADARPFYEGKLRAARYWFSNEMPRIRVLADIIVEADDAFFGAEAAHL